MRAKILTFNPDRPRAKRAPAVSDPWDAEALDRDAASWSQVYDRLLKSGDPIARAVALATEDACDQVPKTTVSDVCAFYAVTARMLERFEARYRRIRRQTG